MQPIEAKPTRPLNAVGPISVLWGAQSAFAQAMIEPIIGVAQYTMKTLRAQVELLRALTQLNSQPEPPVKKPPREIGPGLRRPVV